MGSEQSQGQRGGTCSGANKPERQRYRHKNLVEETRSTSKLAKAILRVSLLLGLGPTGTTATFQEEQQCSSETVDKGAETMWIWIFMVLLFMLWLVFALTAWWFWKRLNVRLGHNERQLAEGDTYMWENRESINAERNNHDQLVRQFNQCLCRANRWRSEYVGRIH